MRLFRVFGLVALTLLLVAPVSQAASQFDSSRVFPTVIYGDDNRLDLYEVGNTLHLELADSTVALMRSSTLQDNGNGTTSVTTKNFGELYNLCTDEPYRDQGSAAFCSGFLVDNDILVTAGHCIRSASDCQNTKFVFGFNIQQEGITPTEVLTSEVYGCGELLHSEVHSNGADFAVIRLDRAVENHTPLNYRQQEEAPTGTPLVVIGHPSGLPTKVAAGANVRSEHNGYFKANLDTYGGNSGSAVFNDETGDIEGILVRGERDFVYRGSCVVSNRCPEGGCRGEDVTKISATLPYIPR